MSRTMTERPDGGVSAPEGRGERAVFTPQFDIRETEAAYILYGDLPGVPPGEVDIRFENGQLSIHGRTPLRHPDIHPSYGEYAIGDYYRAFSVGQAVDAEKIAAEMKNGVLTVTLPKSEAVKPRRVKVSQG